MFANTTDSPLIGSKVQRCVLAAATSALALGVIAAAMVGVPAKAVPSFTDQTAQPCQSCHVGGFGPQLTPFGREFKLRGYTMRTKSFSAPLSAMAVASWVHTKRDQPERPAPHFSRNDNLAFDEGSLFLAGGVGNHFGGFVQVTYDGVDRSWAWDNLDIRLVNTGQIGGKSMVYGLTLNNSPAVQDVWNSTPAWGFPYTDSALAPSPASSPLINGGLAQGVLGLSAYAWVDSSFYLEAGGYSSPRRRTLKWLGADPFDPGDIRGIAPYVRLAYQHTLSGGTFHIGGSLLRASIWPGRDRSSGFADRFTDLAIDGSWQKSFKNGDVATFNARYTHEDGSLRGSCALGVIDGTLPGCGRERLNEFRADASYYFRNKFGVTLSGFSLTGSRNPALYADNGRPVPDSSGLTAQIDATPFGDGKSPLGPRFNLRVGLQYTAYDKFDGVHAGASRNNNLRLFTWLAF